MIDIIRKDNTLEEFGLPELSLMRTEDITTDDWHNPFQFGVVTHQGTERHFMLEHETETVAFSSDKVMIVYAIVPIDSRGEEEVRPEGFSSQYEKACALAERLEHGELFDNRDSDYHEGTVRVVGVVVPKDELEDILGMIRNEPEHYRPENKEG